MLDILRHQGLAIGAAVVDADPGVQLRQTARPAKGVEVQDPHEALLGRQAGELIAVHGVRTIEAADAGRIIDVERLDVREAHRGQAEGSIGAGPGEKRMALSIKVQDVPGCVSCRAAVQSNRRGRGGCDVKGVAAREALKR